MQTKWNEMERGNDRWDYLHFTPPQKKQEEVRRKKNRSSQSMKMDTVYLVD